MSKLKTSKIFTIIKHEYLTKIKTKGFLIGTIFGPLFMLLLIGVPILFAILSEDSSQKKIAVLDYTIPTEGEVPLGELLVEKDTSRFFLTNLSVDVLKERVLSETFDGYIVLPKDFINSGKAEVFTLGGGGLSFVQTMENNVGSIFRRERLKISGLDSNKIDYINKRVDIQTHKITETGTEKDFTEAYAIFGYILGFVIYILMLMYGSFVSRGVIEEKANRIIEIIASSAKPYEIMMGKVVGIGAVGLTQVLAWSIILLAISFFGGNIIEMFVSQPAVINPEMMKAAQPANLPFDPTLISKVISPWIIAGFVFYFLSGYFIYATLFAAIGSAVDQESDAAQIQLPVTMLIILPMLFISYIIANPDGTLSVVLSLVPFFSPILMMVRVAATNVPIWQIAASVIILILTFLGCIWVAARIYRVGILMYGKKPNFKDLFKWIRVAR